ncbi:MAG: hypothetical protein WCI03_12740 [bacterium]|jgi:hypothetical protein
MKLLNGCIWGMAIIVMGARAGWAYDSYSGGAEGGCIDCHGDFRGSTSLKGTIFPSSQNHEMHRGASNMATACNLCHSGSSRTPVYTYTSNGTVNNPGLGCSGCHVGAGLRRHHANNGVTLCYDCHTDGAPPAESVKPPYYNTVDTKAKNPGNTVLAANTNENWSVGDFLGLDNDGNNLYDLADYAIGPYKILKLNRETNNIRITWLTAGGRDNNAVQAAQIVTGLGVNISPDINIPGVGLVTNSYVHVGGATNSIRFYRMSAVVP